LLNYAEEPVLLLEKTIVHFAKDILGVGIFGEKTLPVLGNVNHVSQFCPLFLVNSLNKKPIL
jgi:hypothetical protein